MRVIAAWVCLVLGATSAGAQVVAWPVERPPRPLPARPVSFPPYHLRTLPNGLQVVAVLHHEQPVVSLRMLVRAGAAVDPPGKLGVATLTAALLTQGTTTQSATEMNEAIDFIGGALGAGAGTDLTFVNTVVMKDSFEVGLRMIADMVRRPAFAQEEIERQRQQMVSSLRVSFEDPEFIADAVFGRLVYGYHPYGLPQTGTPETIAGITRADIQAFHRTHFIPNNAILAVVGDLTAEEAFAAVERALGDWPRGDVPPVVTSAPPPPARRVVVIDKPDAVQSEIRLGHIGLPRNHPDHMAFSLAVRILGGEGANRLYQVLRTERGLTYSAQADMHALKESGDVEASTDTRTDATVEALRLSVNEFTRMQRDRVGPRELSDAQAYLTGSFPLSIEDPDNIATQVLNVLFYGLPVEDLQTFRERVNALTPDQVHRAAQVYLRPDRLSIVLVGNAAAFTKQLAAIGFDSLEVIPIGDLDLMATNFRRQARLGRADQPRVIRAAFTQAPAQSPVARPAPADTDEGRALLSRAIAAKGGVERLQQVKSITAVTTSDATTPEGTVTAEVTTYLEYPERVRVETRLPEALIVQVFDGKRAWVQDPAGTHEVPAQAIASLRTTLQRDTIAMLLAAHDGQVRARRLPDARTQEGSVQEVLELSSTRLDPTILYLDPATGLVLRQTYAVGGRGAPLIEERFSDYRLVDGVQVAFTAEVRRGGERMLERRIVSIAFNPPADPARFRRPS